MALKAGTLVSILGATGPASVVTVSAPPGPNVGVVGGYAIWPPASNNGNVVLLYGPKTSSGWTQTTADAQGNTYPVSYQLTGAIGAVGAAGTSILQTSGLPASTVGNPGDVAIDGQGFIYGPKSSASGWPSTPLVSTVGPAGPKGDAGSIANLPSDYTANSFVVTPVSNDSNTVQIAIKNSQGQTLWSADASGNTTVGGTLKATGASTLAGVSCTSLATSGNSTLTGNLNVAGSTVLAGATVSSLTDSGNATVGGTLGVTGATTLGAAACTSMANSGNGTIGGTLGVTGATTLAAASCTSMANSGNGTIGGTLGVSGTSTLAAVNATNLSASGTLTASGAATVAGLTSSATVQAKNLTLTSGSGGVLTFADGTSMSTAATGTSSSGSGSTQVARTCFDMGGFAYGTNTSGTYWTSKKLNATAGTNNVANNDDFAVRMPWAGSIVGFGIQQVNSSAGNTSVMYVKNGTNLTAITNVGSGAGSFWGTHAVTAFPFAAGDLIKFTHAYSGTGATDVYTQLYVQWTDAAQASTGTVTNDPSFNSLTIAPVTGDSTASLVTTPSLTLTSGGGGKLTFADGTSMSTAATGSGGSGSIAASPIDMGTYWNNSVPTSYAPFIQVIYQTSAATMNAFATMPYAGTVKKIVVAYNGTIGGTVTVALYKNGNVTSVTATQAPITISSNAALTSFIGDGGGLTFAVGDTFMFYIKNSGSTTNQAFKGTMHVAFTGVS